MQFISQAVSHAARQNSDLKGKGWHQMHVYIRPYIYIQTYRHTYIASQIQSRGKHAYRYPDSQCMYGILIDLHLLGFKGKCR